MSDDVRGAVFERIHGILSRMHTASSLSGVISELLRGIQAAGFDRARIYRYDQHSHQLIGMDSVGMERPSSFKGFHVHGEGLQVHDRFIAEAQVQHSGFLRAQLYDPSEVGRDPAGVELQKAPDLPWAAVSLVIAGRLYGQVAADNHITRGEISAENLEYLTLLGGLAAQAFFNVDALEREVQQAQAEGFTNAVEHLAWSVGHEMKNASAVVSLAISEISGALRDSNLEIVLAEDLENAVEVIRAMNISSQSLLRLTTELNRGRSPHRLRDLIQLAIESVQSYLKLKNITLRYSKQASVIVEADPHQLIVALVNILRNAIDAIRGNERAITISTRRSQQRVVITFKDTGTGLSEEARVRCFEKGFSTGGSGHSGYGLWRVKEIVTSHGGTVSAANGRRGGAVFTVTLPLYRSAEDLK